MSRRLLRDGIATMCGGCKTRQRPGRAGGVGDREPGRQAEILRQSAGQISEQLIFAAEEMRRTRDIEKQAVGAFGFAPRRGGRRVARRPQPQTAERNIVGGGIDRAGLQLAGFGACVGQRLADRKARCLGGFVQRGDARSARAGDGKNERFARINRRMRAGRIARLFRLCGEKAQNRPARQPD